ncbi:MAG: ABC transporter ATP-binding protein [Defluviitaleaceae bacterium]|nr:ABC transporter ATP-binding protein [Defluviitaleaceae bacterium]
MTIELTNISKRFDKTQALDQVSLRFGGQKIYGLLGNNGAGKSTLLNIITSRYTADNGELTLDGQPMFDDDSALSQIYLLSEKNYYPESLKVKDALRWASIFYPKFNLGRAHELAERFGLPLKKKITALSTGYESIFKIVMAMSTNAPFLLLDEPVLGLDAQHRDMFYKLLIEHYSEKPCTIVISTHLIAEVAGLIEHCVIIKNGRILKDEPCENLLTGGYTISGSAAAVEEYLRGKNVLSVNSLGGLKTACIGEQMPNPASLPQGLEADKLNLQEYFIQLMNDEITK